MEKLKSEREGERVWKPLSFLFQFIHLCYVVLTMTDIHNKFQHSGNWLNGVCVWVCVYAEGGAWKSERKLKVWGRLQINNYDKLWKINRKCQWKGKINKEQIKTHSGKCFINFSRQLNVKQNDKSTKWWNYN